MNDDQIITVARQSFSSVHMDTPVEQIVNRGRAVRARRRIPGMAGALAIVAVAALAVTALLPTAHSAKSHKVQLAAWTVARHSDGTIYVTIRELRDPAGLQDRLRAEGVPASVTFNGNENPSCRNYSTGNPGLTKKVIAPSPRLKGGTLYTVLVIHPSALPRDAGVMISTGHVQHPQQGGVAIGMLVGLVEASPQCTGS